MKVALNQLGGAAGAVVLALLTSVPVKAVEPAPGVTAVAAEELDKRSKQAAESQGESKGMSDSSVRVLMTYAYSLIPEQTAGPDGQPVKVDKSDPNKFVIPNEDARYVIRAATRSAYADVCELPDLAQANYEAMIKAEEAKKSWSPEQLLMINALHLFAVSYFTGNAKIVDEGDDAPAQGDGATVVPKKAEAEPAEQGAETYEAPPAPKCPPEQKQKVMNAINAYVQAAQAAPGKQ